MTSSRETVALTSGEQVVIARQAVRRKAIELGFSLVDQTKVVTAASELARNTVQHGGGGVMTMETVQEGPRRGLALTFVDHGPGIPDVERAMRDGYTTAGGLGLGLSGARRLSHNFSITSTPGHGTMIAIIRWK
jgi:serine/threonine-protein kinase RsbT